MKVRLSFKTPDVVDYAVDELDEECRERARKVMGKFVEFGECLTVEVDLEKGTCEVVPV